MGRRLPRTVVHAVFLDGKDLVLVGDDSNDLARINLGVVVREGGKQYWRRADRPVEP